MAQALGEAIERRRRARRWQVKELAAMLGKSASSVSNYESGKQNPSRPVFRRLLDVLEIPPAERPQWDAWWDEGEADRGQPLRLVDGSTLELTDADTAVAVSAVERVLPPEKAKVIALRIMSGSDLLDADLLAA